MPSSFWGLNIARSGMIAYHAGLVNTAHNVANVKTKGYSKQSLVQQASVPAALGTSYGMVGSGVSALDIVSSRDVYFDNKYRMSTSSVGKYETLDYYMNAIQDYMYAFDEKSGGVTNSIDKLFETISGLTTDTSDSTKRTQVIGYAENMLSYIREAASNLKSLQVDVNARIADTVDQINSYAEQIASLTFQINNVEAYGTTANDLRDKRATLLDELSELVDVEVVDKPAAEGAGNGLNQYIVNVAGSVLVDTYSYNTIKYEVMDTYYCQSDIDNLYSLRWSNGPDVDIRMSDLGGSLQGLFMLRDGNNGEQFSGTAVGSGEWERPDPKPNDPDNTTTCSTLKIQGTGEHSKSLLSLDIPEQNGMITVGNAKYTYEYFELTINADGGYEYTFYLKEQLRADVTDKKAVVGDAVDYRGIPYYMAQLNEFVRTFSYRFNELQEQGLDLDGNDGKSMFIGKDKVNGYEFTCDLNFVDSTKFPITYKSLVDANGDGKVDDTDNVPYYLLTALTGYVDDEFLENNRLLACSDPDDGGVGNGGNLKKMSALQRDTEMFKQGRPDSFLQVMTSTMGVDGQRVNTAAKNARNIQGNVESRRLSVAGVDEDEEGQNLIIYRELLNYQYQVLSIMNEVLDKLINGTAV